MKWLRWIAVVVVAALAAGGAALYMRYARKLAARQAAARALSKAAAPAIEGLAKAGRAADAKRVRAACKGEACGCVMAAGMAFLDLSEADKVGALLDAAPECKRKPLVLGLRAEQAAENKVPEVARTLSDRAIIGQAHNPCAYMARARLAFQGSHMGDTRDAAKKALEYGRGAEAERFIARPDFAQGKLEDARKHFLALVKGEPRDLEGLFTAAVCADKLGNFHEAREGYLSVLQVDPKHAQARYFLALLTFRNGAIAEARHDADELAKIVPPTDERVKRLQALLHSAAGADGGAPHKAFLQVGPLVTGKPKPGKPKH